MDSMLNCEVIGCFERALWKRRVHSGGSDLEEYLCAYHYQRWIYLHPESASLFYFLDEAADGQSRELSSEVDAGKPKDTQPRCGCPA